VRKTRDRHSQDLEAYQEFMRGLEESYPDRREALQRAVEHLSRAVACDPEFVSAHATLSSVAMHIHLEFDPQRAWLEKAEHHCRRALALDPEFPEGHSAHAFILWSPAMNFRHADAIAALEQVLESQIRPHRVARPGRTYPASTLLRGAYFCFSYQIK
jgi:tetratricopeptide (TPR) repeat protein